MTTPARARPAAATGGALQILALGQANLLLLINGITFTSIRSFPNARCTTSRLEAAFSPCGRFIASGSEDGALCLWDVETGAPVAARAAGSGTTFGYPSILHGLSWSPTDHALAIAGFGGGYNVIVAS